MNRRDFLKCLGAGLGSALGAASTRPIGGAVRALRAGLHSNRPNIIFLVADALRSDHLSANGYSRATTPNLDAWVADAGVSFHNATSSSPWTYPAAAAIVTGVRPFALNATWDQPHLPTTVTTLAQYLHAAGYYTAGFVSNGFVSAGRGFGRGFEVYDESVATHPTSYQGVAGELGALAVDWLRTWAQPPPSQPLFLFLYYVDPHTWYHPLPPYDTLYDPTYDGPLTPDVYRDGQDVVAGTIVPTPRDIEHLHALYDGEISYWDEHVGRVLVELQDQYLLDNAIVVVTSDHGEAFGEHGHWTHANCLHEDVLRVPLLMRYSGVIPAGSVVTTPVHSMDLMPTLLDWLGIPIPAGLDAVSVRALAEGSQPAVPRDVYAELDRIVDPDHWAYWIAPRHHLRSIQRDGWKYIHHVRKPEDDELYQLHPSSPYETDNLILSEPARAQELRDAVLRWSGLGPYRTVVPFVTR